LNEAERRREKAQIDEIRAMTAKSVFAEARPTRPIYNITLANVGSDGLPPARTPARPASIGEVLKPGPDQDMELNEAENILTDYVHALPGSQAAMIVAEATSE
jgi:hypothetical protein